MKEWQKEWIEEYPEKPLPKFDPADPPKDVIRWIKRFKKCLKACPDGLWFFCGGSVSILVMDEDGEPVHIEGYGEGGVDPEYEVDSTSAQLFEGGDW